MVITWSRVTPRMYYWDFDSPNTFQLVIAYDPSRYQTFVMYIYKELGWDHQYFVRVSMIGYFSYKYTDENALQLAPSGKSTAFRMHERYGNKGEQGRYMFRVASGSHEVNYDQKCYNWHAAEMRRWRLVLFYWLWTRPCPCDKRLAWMDGRWRADYIQYYNTRGEKMCYYERIPRWQSAQECCYTRLGSLVNSHDGRGGHTFYFHPRWPKQHHKYDVLPKQWCCQFSDNCELFYSVRPTDYCYGYMPLFIGWFYGDPHIRTLDGFQYTFNGLGEYTLIETTHGNFTLQGRTAKARDANGTETDATVFSAFAARDSDSDTVHVEMTSERKGLDVFVAAQNVSNWFNDANVTNDKEFRNVIITKKTITEIEVSFKSGLSLTIGVSAEQLDITVGAPDTFKNQTKGLMGVFNGDPMDDLLPPGVNAVALSNSSSEKTIFNEFGELWRIQPADSLFYYAPGESYLTFARTDFKPLFLEDVRSRMTDEQWATAKQTCQDNKECLFDYAITGKEEAAVATLATNSKNEQNVATLSNRSPNITVDKVFNVTVGQENVLTVVTSDPDGDEVDVTLNSTLTTSATFNKEVYRWTPDSMRPVNISFSVSDGKGGVAAAEVSINLCNCSGSGHGECLFDLLADGYELKQTFRIVQCNCSTGWEGDHCESDYDGCQDNPCTAGTNCTDASPDEEVSSGRPYSCSECPEGTEKDGEKCLPINECDPNNRRDNCEQICVDIDKESGYTCACNAGYRLADNLRNCSDVDECQEGTAGCDQNCQNTNGSYACSCIDGYTLNHDNTSCDITGNMKEECNKLDCSYGCREKETNTYVCFCKSGFALSGDNKSCEDVDECAKGTAGCKHKCTNTEGSFNCSCSDGFQLMNDMKGCQACPSGTWGKDCKSDCNCRDSDTTCNVTTGCVACLDGFIGGDCHDIDECSESNPCDDHATCDNTVGTFKCVCHTGYTQYNATVCEGKSIPKCNYDI
ncbi:hypothetical protein NP493_1002g01061 [Ridgeia piscesae]|uniref:Mucin-like protein n=1 Tax=Ridgeia piscesae TaxID=27915 RepID=A0AAD9NLX4_RIDPI|nr:hypothetical protein NP493_1002g01061 [Ridgeia piscesae]